MRQKRGLMISSFVNTIISWQNVHTLNNMLAKDLNYPGKSAASYGKEH